MSNPALNDKYFQRATQQAVQSEPGSGGRVAGAPGWAAPTPHPNVPMAPDTVSPWPPPGGVTYETMRVGGVASATAVLLAIVAVAGAFGWRAVEVVTAIDRVSGDTVVVSTTIPLWVWGAWIGGFVIALVTAFKPGIARFTGPLYAAATGLFVGGISKLFEAQYEGIVSQAVGLTIGVFAIMLVLFASGAIRVTNKLRNGVIAATGAVMLVYLVSIVARLFGAGVPLIHEAGPIGIGFSIVVVGIAAFNLLLDFDLVQRGVAMQAPRHMEWYAAFALVVSLVWLYIELLRLLAKLRSR